jgi:hypothetical protein
LWAITPAFTPKGVQQASGLVHQMLLSFVAPVDNANTVQNTVLVATWQQMEKGSLLS